MKTFITGVLIALVLLISTAGLAWANGDEYEKESFLEELVEPLGVLTIICLAVTFLLGRFMPRNRKNFFPWHKRMAWITTCSAAVHFLLVASS